uniref:Peptidase S8/S53 domain-containing protein n=1 Tax=Panagrolaimus superbus TaxID=310955 RepID=A0A914Y743_9BILA
MLGLKTLFCKPLSSTNTCQNNTYIPKEATQQEIFLSKYSTFDGRDITIAIIDSGFDVSLEGLQQTSEGRQKVIDCFDFTGVGNVETCIIREIDSKNNILVGLNERKLKIPKNWKNPSGKWHLGLKALFKPTMSKMDSEYSQKLPKLDCIVWNDGRKWCACIETYKNNLKMAKVLTNFRDKHEFSFLKMEGLEMAYCITVHKNGNLLEIFMPYDHHGSVVSQIAAGHFPNNPKKDGLAPGAQLFFMSVIDPHDGYAINLQALKKAVSFFVHRITFVEKVIFN